MHTLAQVWRLACKDWRLFVADRRAACLCLLVPILLASLFGCIFHRPGSRYGPVRLAVLVVAEDDGPLTQAVAAALQANDHLECLICDRATAEGRVASRGCGVAVVLPKGFEGLRVARAEGAARPALGIIHHPSSGLEAQWAEGAVTEAVMREVARQRLGGLGAGLTERPFRVERTTVPQSLSETRVPYDSYGHSFCGMTLQYLLFWGMESGLALLRERQRGIWGRLQASPVSVSALLAGKALSTAGIGLLLVGVTFSFGYLAFGVRVTGSWLGFGALALAVSGLAAATALLVAAVGGAEAQARNVSILVVLTLSMLGGLWLPGFLLPSWAQVAALALPTTWAMRGLNGVVWQGLGARDVLPALGVLGGYIAATFVLAWARLTGVPSWCRLPSGPLGWAGLIGKATRERRNR